MIRVTERIGIPEEEITVSFVKASGPGGQNVNKVATAVQLKFDVANSPSLPESVRKRLKVMAGSRLTSEGVLVIDARRHRTQARNRKDAVERLIELIHKAAQTPRARRHTKPTAASRRRRLENKRSRGMLKKLRHQPAGSAE
ncbi:MAG TPA: aminoacyl-tRNA hydrolase [Desulfobacteraceae bacterium]|nr:aminoacyl-tRNA hydrolase [Desulfobacteraceae bacterium]